MPLDPEVISAIHEASRAEGQPETIASQLVAWLDEMSRRELSKDEHSNRLGLLRDALVLRGEEAQGAD